MSTHHLNITRILSQARLADSFPTSSTEPRKLTTRSIISFAALLCCFQQSTTHFSDIDEEKVFHITKVCAVIALQLRHVFGNSTNPNGSLPNGLPESGDSSFIEAANDLSIALTMVEAVANTFMVLMVQAGVIPSDGIVPSNAVDEIAHMGLTGRAKEAITTKLAMLLGIICTIADCLDNIQTYGKRARHIDSILSRLRLRLEELNIRADVSFAIEFARPDSFQVPSQSCLDEQASYDSGSTMAMTRYSASFDSPPSTPLEQGQQTLVRYPTVPVGVNHGHYCGQHQAYPVTFSNQPTYPTLGASGYGSTASTLYRQEYGEMQGQHSSAWTFDANLLDGRTAPPLRSTYAGETASISIAGWTSSTGAEQLNGLDWLARRYPVSGNLMQGAFESVPLQTDSRSVVRTTQVYTSARFASMMPDESYCK